MNTTATTQKAAAPAGQERPLWWAALAVLLAVGCGLAISALSERALRWQLYPVAGVVALTIALLTNPRKILIASFVIGLSVNVHYYLTQPLPQLYIGNSSATAYSIPLVLIPAILLLLWGRFSGDWQELRWGREISVPAAYFIIATAIAAVPSNVRFFGIIVVYELLQYFVIFLAALNIVRTRQDAAFVMKLLALTLFLQCLVFFVQTATGVTFNMAGQVLRSGGAEGSLVRATGTIGPVPSGFATFVEPLICIAFAFYRTTKAARVRAFCGMLVVMGTIAVVLTLNRSSWAGVILGIAATEWLCRRRELVRGRKVRGALRMVVILGLGIVLVFPLISPRLSADHKGDFDTRYNLLRAAINMIAANPVVGVGPGGYSYNVRRYLPSGIGWVFVVHNEYLLIWAERGTLGLLAWLLWLRAGFSLSLEGGRRREGPLQAFAIGCSAGLFVLMWELVWNSFEPFPVYALMWTMFGLLLAHKSLADTSTPEAGPFFREAAGRA